MDQWFNLYEIPVEDFFLELGKLSDSETKRFDRVLAEISLSIDEIAQKHVRKASLFVPGLRIFCYMAVTIVVSGILLQPLEEFLFKVDQMKVFTAPDY